MHYKAKIRLLSALVKKFASILDIIEITACEPFVAVTDGFSLLLIAFVCQHFDNDSCAEREAFYECLTLG